MANISPGQIYQMITGVGDAFEGSFKESRQRGLDDEAEGAASRLLGRQSGAAKSASPAINFSDLGSDEGPKFNAAGKLPTFAGGETSRPMTMPPSPELAKAIQDHATAAGLDPVDLATAISYETAGTFDPWKAGPTTKWGQHRGLIQWGEPQAKQYGVREGMPVGEQVAAAVKYLQDRGVKPGMGLMDIYSAINAGSVGRYDASDEAAGGAPGTVADKVNNQMAGHKKKAQALLASFGGQPNASAADAPAPGAENAQGFVVPGAAGAGRVSTGMTPELYRDLRIMMRSEKYRPMATQLLQQASKQRDLKTLDLGNAWGILDDQANIVRQIPKQQNPMTVSPGSTVYDPNTRQALFTADKPAEAPTTRQIKQADGSEVVVQWNQQTRAWEPMPAPEGGAAVKGPPKLTEVQSKDVGFYNRGSKIIDRLDQQDQSLTDTWSKLGGNLSNYLKSDAYRQAEQTGREFLAVILRKDTGAAVTPQEMEQYSSIYLPQPADDPDTIQQKKAARRTALEGIRMGLGTAEVLFNSQEALRGAASQTQQTAPNAMAPSRADLEAEARRRGLLK